MQVFKAGAAALLAGLALSVAGGVQAAGLHAGIGAGNDARVVQPASNVEHSGDKGVYAHTNLQINNHLGVAPSAITPDKVPFGESAASLQQFFFFPSNGGSMAIGIVDAFGWPSAKNAFNDYAKWAGLPQETSSNINDPANKVFTILYQNGHFPRVDPTGGGWELEQALDIEIAHAIAPKAHIFLIETDSNSFHDLLAGVKLASQYVKEVNMSWSGSEFYGQRDFDVAFTTPGVVYVASSGDSGGPTVGWPGSSRNVVSAGGVTLVRNAQGYAFALYGWSGSTGGISALEPEPKAQQLALGINGGRLVPDISFDADPTTGFGVWALNCGFYGTGWWQVGGTSESAPALCAMINDAGSFMNSSPDELLSIYGAFTNNDPFYDPTQGDNRYYLCVPGYDLVTGVGTPLGETAL